MPTPKENLERLKQFVEKFPAYPPNLFTLQGDNIVVDLSSIPHLPGLIDILKTSLEENGVTSTPGNPEQYTITREFQVNAEADDKTQFDRVLALMDQKTRPSLSPSKELQRLLNLTDVDFFDQDDRVLIREEELSVEEVNILLKLFKYDYIGDTLIAIETANITADKIESLRHQLNVSAPRPLPQPRLTEAPPASPTTLTSALNVSTLTPPPEVQRAMELQKLLNLPHNVVEYQPDRVVIKYTPDDLDGPDRSPFLTEEQLAILDKLFNPRYIRNSVFGISYLDITADKIESLRRQLNVSAPSPQPPLTKAPPASPTTLTSALDVSILTPSPLPLSPNVQRSMGLPRAEELQRLLNLAHNDFFYQDDRVLIRDTALSDDMVQILSDIFEHDYIANGFIKIKYTDITGEKIERLRQQVNVSALTPPLTKAPPAAPAPADPAVLLTATAPTLTPGLLGRTTPPPVVEATGLTLSALHTYLTHYQYQVQPVSNVRGELEKLEINLGEAPNDPKCIAQKKEGGVQFCIGSMTPENQKTQAITEICQIAADACNAGMQFQIPRNENEETTFKALLTSLKQKYGDGYPQNPTLPAGMTKAIMPIIKGYPDLIRRYPPPPPPRHTATVTH